MSEQAASYDRTKKHTGRPSVYGPIVVGKLIGAFQLGLSVSTACDIAGINPDTFYEWMNKYDDFSEKVTTARTYAKILAAQQIQDVLQDVTRGRKDPKTGKVTEAQKYSETTRVNTARWWLEKTEKETFGSQSIVGAKVEINDKGGTTATLVYATDQQFKQLIENSAARSGIEEIDPGQLLEILEGGSEGEAMAGGEDQGSTPPVHSEELQDEHPPLLCLPEPRRTV